jgi:putative polyketide hydroxylase
MDTIDHETTAVLIVGGGYAGLASALFLADQGVPALLVDRHPAVSVQGRARGINQRTMELYRPLRLAEAIRDAGRPFDDEAGVVRCHTLAGDWQWLLDDDTRKPLPELTPADFVMADQRSVEPLLADAARQRGAGLRFGTRCRTITADDDGVTAIVEDVRSGVQRTIRCRYLIAADGFRGTLREQAGIRRDGPGVINSWITALVEADLTAIVRRRAMFWIVVNDEIGSGSFLSTSVPGQWAVSIAYDPATRSAAHFTPRVCADLAHAMIGADVPVRVIDVAAWEEAVGVVERYRNGRVLLVGDAAHVWPPAGAMGANAAVQDAHNLAWKLAAVLRGWAGPALLDSYEAERRPVALALADLTVRRQQARFGAGSEADDVDDILCTFGQRYHSTALAGSRPGPVYGTALTTTAVPGLRAPHLWLAAPGAAPVSVHDLCHDAFVLLSTGAAGPVAARRAAADLGVPLRAYRVGTDLADVEKAWPVRYAATENESVLIRPDGYVAWRGTAPELISALTGVLGR